MSLAKLNILETKKEGSLFLFGEQAASSVVGDPEMLVLPSNHCPARRVACGYFRRRKINKIQHEDATGFHDNDKFTA